MTIDYSGNVGIGVTSPGYTLDVSNGTVYANNFRMGNALYLGSSNYYINNNGTSFGSNVAFITSSYLQGTVFYDTANTGYYVQPSSTSQLNNVQVAGTINQSGPGRTSTCTPSNYDIKIGSSDLYLYFKSTTSNNYAGVLQYMRSDPAYSWPLLINPYGGNVGIGTNYNPGYTLEVNGSFAATSKSFIIEHPTKPGKKLVHGVTEGPEHSVFVRGRIKDNTITLPEYWQALVDEDNITVQLTPIGKHQDLCVVDVNSSTVTIKNENLVNKAIDCYYFIQAERKDIPKLVTEV